MLGTALWLAVLGAAGAVVLMCALVAFMFGPLYYAEYRVGKDIHKRYRAAGPEQSWYSLSGGAATESRRRADGAHDDPT